MFRPGSRSSSPPKSAVCTDPTNGPGYKENGDPLSDEEDNDGPGHNDGPGGGDEGEAGNNDGPGGGDPGNDEAGKEHGDEDADLPNAIDGAAAANTATAPERGVAAD